ncbi:hypothetical protein M2103_001260 [Ereboglobus sp. PH5-5]|nr:hypothetical protein [Ereboglobus sp. PH5-5]
MTRTFCGDNDYTYTLQSRGTHEEFLLFVEKMKMSGHRINDTRYEKKSENNHLIITINYEEGWIIYTKNYT